MIRRIGLLLVAALLVAMLAIGSVATPAFADAGPSRCPGSGDTNGSKCKFGGQDGKKHTIKVTGNGNCTATPQGLCNNQ